MNTRKKVLVVVNPISGGYAKEKMLADLSKGLSRNKFNLEIHRSQSPEHADTLCRNAVEDTFDMVVAVGGDGTISRAASFLIGSDTALGIIPAGSGNGYARSLGIPMRTSRAIEVINRTKVSRVDTGILNGRTFVNVAGLGFDAHVSDCFQHAGRRGFLTYSQIVMREWKTYRSSTYRIAINQNIYEEDAFLLSICLGNQYGNQAFIAPLADLRDGLFHTTLIRKANAVNIPTLLWRLFNKGIRESKNVKVFRSPALHIQRAEPGVIHLDGDPYSEGMELEIGIRPLSLQVIV